ncbi:MAG: HAMP domain-containing histidine kinase, partial [Flammeovirgaceae bacterium]|nr:HAMP domain-containing histidine kinase [Flammeovirgaceae bacterium]MDW8288547.1 HAMP domain-containing sensor histidine kinase [Flammeovirgaceae bacterium]
EIEKQKNDIMRQKEELERKNKELEEINEEKNQLISILAHDLKSPLSRINGLLNLYYMTSPPLTEEQKSLLNMIEFTAERMKEMVIRILDVKAIELQSLNLKLTRTDISQVLNQAIAQNKVLAERKQIHIYVACFASPTYALVDEQFLFQVYDNLLSNAIKFSPKYSTVHIYHQTIQNCVRTQIKDEGQGLTPEDKQKLFRKFQTLSAKPTGNEVSTGLGLAIVKKFVDAMNGRVWCESEYLKGASFFVEFTLNK